MRKVKVRIGTLNVCPMVGKSMEVVDVIKRIHIDIMCVKDTNRKGSKAREKDEGYKQSYIVTTSTNNGVKCTEGELKVKRLNERIMLMVLDLRSTHCLAIIFCYAPQIGQPQRENDDFWKCVYDITGTIKEERFILGGEQNGGVGVDNYGYNQLFLSETKRGSGEMKDSAKGQRPDDMPEEDNVYWFRNYISTSNSIESGGHSGSKAGVALRIRKQEHDEQLDQTPRNRRYKHAAMDDGVMRLNKIRNDIRGLAIVAEIKQKIEGQLRWYDHVDGRVSNIYEKYCEDADRRCKTEKTT
ncbi:hypothetical protein GJ496_010429 [Pomphorhynchus laevis]|nr:hypothetical protein GJ496_010429 [Pomphorhynchus laevis]